MSGTVELTAHQKWQSHQVNCNVCNKFTEAHMQEVEKNVWVAITKLKEYRLICVVGAILLNNAVKEQQKEKFKPTSFPFIAKVGQEVYANYKGFWLKGRVIERGTNADGTITGYEILTDEFKTAIKLGQKVRIYVNKNNVQPVQQRTNRKPAKDTTPTTETASTGFRINV